MENGEDDCLAREKWVRVMCDYGAEGVWDKDGVSREPEELAISRELMDRIYKWQEWHDRIVDRYYDEELSDDDESLIRDYIANSAEGYDIALAVKSALPDWTVVYFDEAKSRDKTSRRLTSARSYFEYELHLDQEDRPEA
ncbi:hypothetical protein [Phyllobacterium leguminum]|uniref:Uncharacterized protein n=1 Tax=Phyllobacterium leguminum TaxID=314237 RepID=A0A318T3N2_9HYPH|nr:hypothetical protein [Phyllobacterium leguminum]PYE86669.1 hypothetical protein C7477_12134 [Phyllobacterium leguminum]